MLENRLRCFTICLSVFFTIDSSKIFIRAFCCLRWHNVGREWKPGVLGKPVGSLWRLEAHLFW